MASPMRLASLNRLRCSIFNTSYNPTSIRTGAKYLRARLRGPSMVNYYPEQVNFSKIWKEWPRSGVVDMKEVQRKIDVQRKQERGKGTPKKAKTEAESRRLHRKR